MNEEIIAKIIIGGITGGLFVLYQSVVRPYFENKKHNSITPPVEEVKALDNSKTKNVDKDKTIWEINGVLWYSLAVMAVISYLYSSIKSQNYLVSLLLLIPIIILIRIAVNKFYGTQNFIFKFTEFILHYPKKIFVKILDVFFG
jgi:hypothetical protein